VAAHLTEEEQIEALKRWWKDNGKYTVALILAVVLAWFGWSSWKDRQAQLAQQASSQFAELVATVEAPWGESLTQEQAATAQVIANDILDTQADSLYGNFAALLLARLAAEAGELEEAVGHLEQAKRHAANASIERLADLRLARVLTAQGDYDGALARLTENVDEGYQAAYSEARGDVHLAQGDLELAASAYEAALAALQPQQSNRRSLIQLKLDNSRVAETGAAEAEVSPAPANEGGA
jgi:predicted negative regulator of RcsB-dependent stress response